MNNIQNNEWEGNRRDRPEKARKEAAPEKLKKQRSVPQWIWVWFRRVVWMGFFVFVVLLFLWAYNLTFSFVMDRHQTDIPALIGNISDEDALRIYIPMGSSSRQIAEILEKKGIISDSRLFILYSRLMGNEGMYQSGFHNLNRQVDYDNPVGFDMIIHIITQDPIANPTQRVAFPEGMTFLQTVDRFMQYDFIDRDELMQALETGEFPFAFVNDIPDDPRRSFRLEGYLFPDTYLFDITLPAERAVHTMLANFDRVFREAYRNRAAAMGLTIDEVVIIASLIEREAKWDEERAKIAGVIYNRLRSNDPSLRRLQIDATIQYIFLNETGQTKEFLSSEDTRIDHPYNTYLHEGLPPGPICNPGEMSIIAALFPEEHNYYFYVVKGDGFHAFARTYEEHLANIRRYRD